MLALDYIIRQVGLIHCIQTGCQLWTISLDRWVSFTVFRLDVSSGLYRQKGGSHSLYSDWMLALDYHQTGGSHSLYSDWMLGLDYIIRQVGLIHCIQTECQLWTISLDRWVSFTVFRLDVSSGLYHQTGGSHSLYSDWMLALDYIIRKVGLIHCIQTGCQLWTISLERWVSFTVFRLDVSSGLYHQTGGSHSLYSDWMLALDYIIRQVGLIHCIQIVCQLWTVSLDRWVSFRLDVSSGLYHQTGGSHSLYSDWMLALDCIIRQVGLIHCIQIVCQLIRQVGLIHCIQTGCQLLTISLDRWVSFTVFRPDVSSLDRWVSFTVFRLDVSSGLYHQTGGSHSLYSDWMLAHQTGGSHSLYSDWMLALDYIIRQVGLIYCIQTGCQLWTISLDRWVSFTVFRLDVSSGLYHQTGGSHSLYSDWMLALDYIIRQVGLIHCIQTGCQLIRQVGLIHCIQTGCQLWTISLDRWVSFTVFRLDVSSLDRWVSFIVFRLDVSSGLYHQTGGSHSLYSDWMLALDYIIRQVGLIHCIQTGCQLWTISLDRWVSFTVFRLDVSSGLYHQTGGSHSLYSDWMLAHQTGGSHSLYSDWMLALDYIIRQVGLIHCIQTGCQLIRQVGLIHCIQTGCQLWTISLDRWVSFTVFRLDVSSGLYHQIGGSHSLYSDWMLAPDYIIRQVGLIHCIQTGCQLWTISLDRWVSFTVFRLDVSSGLYHQTGGSHSLYSDWMLALDYIIRQVGLVHCIQTGCQLWTISLDRWVSFTVFRPDVSSLDRWVSFTVFRLDVSSGLYHQTGGSHSLYSDWMLAHQTGGSHSLYSDWMLALDYIIRQVGLIHCIQTGCQLIRQVGLIHCIQTGCQLRTISLDRWVSFTVFRLDVSSLDRWVSFTVFRLDVSSGLYHQTGGSHSLYSDWMLALDYIIRQVGLIHCIQTGCQLWTISLDRWVSFTVFRLDVALDYIIRQVGLIHCIQTGCQLWTISLDRWVSFTVFRLDVSSGLYHQTGGSHSLYSDWMLALDYIRQVGLIHCIQTGCQLWTISLDRWVSFTVFRLDVSSLDRWVSFTVFRLDVSSGLYHQTGGSHSLYSDWMLALDYIIRQVGLIYCIQTGCQLWTISLDRWVSFTVFRLDVSSGLYHQTGGSHSLYSDWMLALDYIIRQVGLIHCIQTGCQLWTISLDRWVSFTVFRPDVSSGLYHQTGGSHSLYSDWMLALDYIIRQVGLIHCIQTGCQLWTISLDRWVSFTVFRLDVSSGLYHQTGGSHLLYSDWMLALDYIIRQVGLIYCIQTGCQLWTISLDRWVSFTVFRLDVSSGLYHQTGGSHSLYSDWMLALDYIIRQVGLIHCIQTGCQLWTISLDRWVSFTVFRLDVSSGLYHQTGGSHSLYSDWMLALDYIIRQVGLIHCIQTGCQLWTISLERWVSFTVFRLYVSSLDRWVSFTVFRLDVSS